MTLEVPGPPDPAARSRVKLVVGMAAVLAVLVVAVTLLLVGILGDDESDSTTAKAVPTTAVSTETTATAEQPISETLTDTPVTPTARPVIAPPAIPDADTYDIDCRGGYSTPGRSEWGTHSARGSDATSCGFARSVLIAYLAQNPAPTNDLRTITAPGTVPCPSTGARCAGDDFVMDCRLLGADPWITCTGGNNARVYIY